MRIILRPTAAAAAGEAAGQIATALRAAPDLTLCLATGGTMIPLYATLLRGGTVRFDRAGIFALDEYVGLGPDDPRSYRAYLDRYFLRHLPRPPQGLRLLRGDAPDARSECDRIEALIAAQGGIDLQLLGIGGNGHIGFNEPGAKFDSRTRVVTLTAATRAANARFFDRPEDVPRQALTMGVGTIMQARRCLLLATGAAKAPAVARLVRGPVGADCPATALRNHGGVQIVLDAAAAGELKPDELARLS